MTVGGDRRAGECGGIQRVRGNVAGRDVARRTMCHCRWRRSYLYVPGETTQGTLPGKGQDAGFHTAAGADDVEGLKHMAGLIGTLTDIVVSRAEIDDRWRDVCAWARSTQGDSTLQATGIRTIRGAERERGYQREGGAGAVSGAAGLLRQDVEHAEGKVPAVFRQSAHGRGSPAFAGSTGQRSRRICRFMWTRSARCWTIRGATGAAGSFYSGGYDVAYEPVARGGKNFLQRAKVGFDVEVSK